METITNSIEDSLIDSLNFTSSPGGSYLSNRKSSTWYAAGAQTYVSGTGARLVRIPITSSDSWLDPGSIRVVFT